MSGTLWWLYVSGRGPKSPDWSSHGKVPIKKRISASPESELWMSVSHLLLAGRWSQQPSRCARVGLGPWGLAVQTCRPSACFPYPYITPKSPRLCNANSLPLATPKLLPFGHFVPSFAGESHAVSSTLTYQIARRILLNRFKA